MSIQRTAAIVIKELIQLKRDRMTFGMIVMIPIVQLLLFGYAINTNIRHIPVGVIDHSQTSLSRTIIQNLEATQVVKVEQHLNNIAETEKLITSEKIRAVLILPHDLAQRTADHTNNPLAHTTTTPLIQRPIGQWVIDGSDIMIASTIKGLRGMPLQALISGQANQNTTATFATTLFYNPEQRTVVNTVPGLIGIILTMTMIMFTAAAIVRERERGNLEFLIATPIRPFELMLGKIIPYVAIGLIQVLIILLIGIYLFAMPVNGSLINFAAATLLFIIATLSLGLVLSTIATSQLQAMQLTVFILLPSILLSGFMFPYEGMPVGAQWLAELLPATHFMRLVRGILLRDAALADLSSDLLFLSVFCAIGMTLAIVRFKKRLD